MQIVSQWTVTSGHPKMNHPVAYLFLHLCHIYRAGRYYCIYSVTAEICKLVKIWQYHGLQFESEESRDNISLSCQIFHSWDLFS